MAVPEHIEKKLKAVIRRIEESAAFNGLGIKNFNESTSVLSLARASGLSERSLRDWFKIYTNSSISKYVSKRRMDYAARVLRLFPETPKSTVAEIIGLNSSHALYPFMKNNGVEDIDGLKGRFNESEYQVLPFRINTLADSILFYTHVDTIYDRCTTTEFETDNWDNIEKYVTQRFKDVAIINYVGFAIDRYVENNTEEGVFLCGILCQNIPHSQPAGDLSGDIGWTLIPGKKYAVFTHNGSYEDLTTFYNSTLYTLSKEKNIQIDKASLIMEVYVNSPVDTLVTDLITEIWVPLND